MSNREVGPQFDGNKQFNEEMRIQDIRERIELLKANIEKIETLLRSQDLSKDDVVKLANTLKLVQEELGKSNFVIDQMTKDLQDSSE